MRIVIALLISCAAIGVMPAATPLDGIQLGTHVSGPELDPDDLVGRVVLVHLWGFDRAACSASLGSIAAYARKFPSDKLVVIGFSYWDEQVTAAVAAGAGNDRYAVVTGARLQGGAVDGKTHCFLFDGSGQQAWDGPPERLQERAVAELVAKCPPTRFGDCPHWSRQAAALAALRSPLAKVLAELRAARSGEAPPAREAEALLAGFGAWLATWRGRIDGDRYDRPQRAQATLERLCAALKGDELSAPFDQLRADLAADHAFQDGIAAEKALTAVVASATKALADRGEDGAPRDAASAKRIAGALAQIEKAYPATAAAEESRRLRARWKLPADGGLPERKP